MILDLNTNPKFSLYYTGAILLNFIIPSKRISLIELYLKILDKENTSFTMFIYSIDWLYLLNLIEINIEGEIIYVH